MALPTADIRGRFYKDEQFLHRHRMRSDVNKVCYYNLDYYTKIYISLSILRQLPNKHPYK